MPGHFDLGVRPRSTDSRKNEFVFYLYSGAIGLLAAFALIELVSR
jgi:hypothetical protein